MTVIFGILESSATQWYQDGTPTWTFFFFFHCHVYSLWRNLFYKKKIINSWISTKKIFRIWQFQTPAFNLCFHVYFLWYMLVVMQKNAYHSFHRYFFRVWLLLFSSHCSLDANSSTRITWSSCGTRWPGTLRSSSGKTINRVIPANLLVQRRVLHLTKPWVSDTCWRCSGGRWSRGTGFCRRFSRKRRRPKWTMTWSWCARRGTTDRRSLLLPSAVLRCCCGTAFMSRKSPRSSLLMPIVTWMVAFVLARTRREEHHRSRPAARARRRERRLPAASRANAEVDLWPRTGRNAFVRSGVDSVPAVWPATAGSAGGAWTCPRSAAAGSSSKLASNAAASTCWSKLKDREPMCWIVKSKIEKNCISDGLVLPAVQTFGWVGRQLEMARSLMFGDCIDVGIDVVIFFASRHAIITAQSLCRAPWWIVKITFEKRCCLFVVVLSWKKFFIGFWNALELLKNLSVCRFYWRMLNARCHLFPLYDIRSTLILSSTRVPQPMQCEHFWSVAVLLEPSCHEIIFLGCSNFEVRIKTRKRCICVVCVFVCVFRYILNQNVRVAVKGWVLDFKFFSSNFNLLSPEKKKNGKALNLQK